MWWGVRGRAPPVNRITDACKNITFPQLAGSRNIPQTVEVGVGEGMSKAIFYCNTLQQTYYRSGTVNSKSFIGKVLFQIK